MAAYIQKNLCMQCGICVDICPEDILTWEEGYPYVRHPEECWYCGSCVYECPSGAIGVSFDVDMGIQYLPIKG